MQGADRQAIEEMRRPEIVELRHQDLGVAYVRDNKPLSDDRLKACLTDGLTPGDWCRELNRRVFFWPTEQRLKTLLAARPTDSQPILS